MVLMTGLDSIIESLYLKEELTCSAKLNNILVNPMSSYLIKKTVIISLKSYPIGYIKELLDNKNTVISRFKVDDERVIVDPYELRMNENIVPLGKKVNLINEEIYNEVNHIFDTETSVLYYPKPNKCMDYIVNGDLTVIGYLAYQLGCRLNGFNKPIQFNYLDIIKMKNGILI